jgi:hypothetical protein
MRSAAMLSISDCVHDGIRPGVAEPTKWQHIGNEINAAFVFARADFVNVHASFNSKGVLEKFTGSVRSPAPEVKYRTHAVAQRVTA